MANDYTDVTDEIIPVLYKHKKSLLGEDGFETEARWTHSFLTAAIMKFMEPQELTLWREIFESIDLDFDKVDLETVFGKLLVTNDISHAYGNHRKVSHIFSLKADGKLYLAGLVPSSLSQEEERKVRETMHDFMLEKDANAKAKLGMPGKMNHQGYALSSGGDDHQHKHDKKAKPTLGVQNISAFNPQTGEMIEVGSIDELPEALQDVVKHITETVNGYFGAGAGNSPGDPSPIEADDSDENREYTQEDEEAVENCECEGCHARVTMHSLFSPRHRPSYFFDAGVMN